ncbi:MAG: polysaccharide pyruvyl transferase family protein [Prevotellaceae bacterium]|nr:polysaccharide pyruvyl transferase family protein [Prevotellaceae bacterium]
MKILLVNQPLNNRGDESAHKALVRTIIKEMPDVELTVLFLNKREERIGDSVKHFAVQSPQVKYRIFSPLLSKGMYSVMKKGQKTGKHALWFLHPALAQYMSYFKKADIVVCAPGGMCMGGFQDWKHLFNLQCAKLYNKPLAYFGRSIGPFPTVTENNRIFKQISMEMLEYFSFLSIRDNKSLIFVKELGIMNCQSVVDTAFLETPNVPIPNEIIQSIGNSDYFVFVPNLLIWHPAYIGRVTKECIIDFYIKLLEEMFKTFPQYKVVMLPQTFNSRDSDWNDVNLFRSIARKVNDSRVVVINDQYNSDIQQTIISKSKIVVGARYHSIVFALNNNVPFISLSYEHKMEGLLQTLGDTSSMINIENLFTTKDSQTAVLRQFREKLQSLKYNSCIGEKAKNIVYQGFIEFKKFVDCHR